MFLAGSSRGSSLTEIASGASRGLSSAKAGPSARRLYYQVLRLNGGDRELAKLPVRCLGRDDSRGASGIMTARSATSRLTSRCPARARDPSQACAGCRAPSPHGRAAGCAAMVKASGLFGATASPRSTRSNASLLDLVTIATAGPLQDRQRRVAIGDERHVHGELE
jgi:hypothetical protein